MKESILYLYHFNVSNVIESDDYTMFNYHDKNYYLTKLKRSESDFNELLKTTSNLKNVFPFIPNVDGSLISNINNTYYVLVETNNENVEYDLLEILSFQKQMIITPKKYQNEWGKLWSDKIDYLEYQVHELGKSYPIIVSSFSYFVALAENAISYVNKLVPTNPHLVISHRRVVYPNIRLNFANPLNFLFDLEVRDIAEYLKSLFFVSSKEALIDLQAYINLNHPDAYLLSMLYARLLYPSFYFDLETRVIENKALEDELVSIIDKIDEYELFLKDAWLLINKYTSIEPVPWILALDCDF